MWLTGIAPLPQFMAVEAVFSLNGVVELGGGHDTQQAVVIGLLYAFELQLNLVALADGFLTAFLVGGFDSAQLLLA